MKNIKYICLIVLLSIVGSCDLNETPYNIVTPGAFYKTPNGILQGVNGIYAALRDMTYTDSYLYLSNVADAYITSKVGRSWTTWNVTVTDKYVDEVWSYLYRGINITNEVINALEEGIPDLDTELANRYAGEARFIRAFYYYNLVMHWGDVYLTTEATHTIETEAIRNSESEVWDFILSELDFCIDNLPEKYPDTDYGRVTKNAARQLKALSLLTVKREDQASLTEALNLANAIINSGANSLVDSHAELFDIHNQRNPEIIFPVLYSANPELNGRGNRAHMFFTCGYSEEHPGVSRVVQYGRGWSRVKASTGLIELFDENIDQRFDDDFRKEWNITSETVTLSMFNPDTKADETITMLEGEPAMKMYKRMPTPDDIKAIYPTWGVIPVDISKKSDYDIQSADNPDGEWPSNTKFMNWKFFIHTTKHSDPLRVSAASGDGSRDMFVYRLGETYLIAAEAAHLLDDNSKAAEYINVIRERAAKEGKESEMEVSASDISIDFILDERARELCGEYQRWFDLKRTGKTLERIRNSVDISNPYCGEIKDYQVLRPIPENQLTRMSNPEDFPQNPGY